MYLEDTQLHSLQRVQQRLTEDQKSLEARIIKSNVEYDKQRMCVELGYVLAKRYEVEGQIARRLAELEKPKSFWGKLFRK